MMQLELRNILIKDVQFDLENKINKNTLYINKGY